VDGGGARPHLRRRLLLRRTGVWGRVGVAVVATVTAVVVVVVVVVVALVVVVVGDLVRIQVGHVAT